MIEIKTCDTSDYLHYDEMAVHPQNADLRIISEEAFQKLKNSFIEQGFYEPIHIWVPSMWIIAGNHRYKAACELIGSGEYEFVSSKGKNYFPVILHDVSEKIAMGIMLQTNSFYAEWVETALNAAIRDFENIGGNTGILAYNNEEVEELLEEAITEGEEIIEKIEVDEEKVKEELINVNEDYCSIVLPLPIHRQLTEILSGIAKMLNPDWTEGDYYQEAVQAMCQKWRESNMTEKI